MECRICLESDDPETMLQPCQCRGTSAYVHRRCLERYLYFYPDGICRVCLGQIVYYDANAPRQNYVLLFILMTLMAYNSGLPLPQMLMLFAVSSGLLYYYYILNALTPLNMWAILLSMMFFSIPTQDFGMSLFFIFSLILYASVSLVPAGIVALLFAIQLLGVYSGMIMYAAFRQLNPCAYSMIVVLNVMVWILWVRFRPQINV